MRKSTILPGVLAVKLLLLISLSLSLDPAMAAERGRPNAPKPQRPESRSVRAEKARRPEVKRDQPTVKPKAKESVQPAKKDITFRHDKRSGERKNIDNRVKMRADKSAKEAVKPKQKVEAKTNRQSTRYSFKETPLKQTDKGTRSVDTLNKAKTFEMTKRAVRKMELVHEAPGIKRYQGKNKDWITQIRTKEGDIADKHIHIERINMKTKKVTKNLHLYWN